MANKIVVDTAKVVTAADQISKLNNELDQEFEQLENAIQRLNGRWNSKASDGVIGHFFSIKNNCKDSRYKVMQDYSNFLKQQVSVAYDTTETGNKSLADAFK
jgi:uncharacterized protein YukE